MFETRRWGLALVCVGALVACEAEDAGSGDAGGAGDAAPRADGAMAPDGGADAGVTPDMAAADAGRRDGGDPLPGLDAGAGCQTDNDCEGPRRCVEGVCVACLADSDCVAGYLCTEGECVEGCRDSSTCPLGTTCNGALCQPGCDSDDRCAEGSVCVGQVCQACAALDPCAPEGLPAGCPPVVEPDCGCAQDGDCEAGQICEARACREGCRPGGCGEGEQCDAATLTCVPVALMCEDVTLYPDSDGDGFGVDAGTQQQCLLPDEAVEGFARASGDCRAGDAWAHPQSSEICGDWVDDDCDGDDVACPESVPAIRVPDWDCTGEPPAGVAAYARFPDGAGYFQDGGCFFFFEGLPGEFYVKRVLARASNDPSCAQINGCTCPSLNGWPSYDRRMYAFTRAGAAEACPPIEIIDHGGERQPVSNDCRKYLYQMHFYDIPYSFVAGSRAEFERRLALFPTVEVACAADRPHANLPYQSLLNAPVVQNPNWVPLAD
ncbi:MAG: hypothetical protein H6702_18420 [Myxococcales bacterium]|nr:hypothetical protein [Myxococcales bacterium]